MPAAGRATPPVVGAEAFMWSGAHRRSPRGRSWRSSPARPGSSAGRAGGVLPRADRRACAGASTTPSCRSRSGCGCPCRRGCVPPCDIEGTLVRRFAESELSPGHLVAVDGVEARGRRHLSDANWSASLTSASSTAPVSSSISAATSAKVRGRGAVHCHTPGLSVGTANGPVRTRSSRRGRSRSR